MKIIQIIPDIYYGDGVGNDCLAIDKVLKDSGFVSEIYAINIDEKLKGKVNNFSEIKDKVVDDVIIYHLSTGSEINEWIFTQTKSKKIMIYHNITEPDFFLGYNDGAYRLCKNGLAQVKKLCDSFDIVIADSEFNKKQLVEMGYKCPIKVFPILIPFEDYEKEPDGNLLKKYNDGFTNIIFVGRIVPNKKQEDIILAFYEYQKHYNPDSRLFLVGNPAGYESYALRLKEFAEKLGVKNIIFTGRTRFCEILSYYRLSDLFLCMSEHEGFCIPLVESMFFNKPVVAYDSSAISCTLGGSGFLLSEKESLETAAVINRILTDEKLRNDILENQRERLGFFSYEKTKNELLGFLNEVIESL